MRRDRDRLPLVTPWAAHLALGLLLLGVGHTYWIARSLPHRELVEILLGTPWIVTVGIPLVMLLCLLPASRTLLVLGPDGITVERWGRTRKQLAWESYLGWREERHTTRTEYGGGVTRTLVLRARSPAEEIRVTASYPYHLGQAAFERIVAALDQSAPREGSGEVLHIEDLTPSDRPIAARWVIGIGLVIFLPSVSFMLFRGVLLPNGGPPSFSFLPGVLIGILFLLLGLFLHAPWSGTEPRTPAEAGTKRIDETRRGAGSA